MSDPMDWCGTSALPEPADPRQLALIRLLVRQHPDWADHLNGLEWERCFDVLDGSKFVSHTEATRVIVGFLEFIGVEQDDES